MERGRTPTSSSTLPSGRPVDAASAHYVESEVYTHRESANRIHVFESSKPSPYRHRNEYVLSGVTYDLGQMITTIQTGHGIHE